MTPEEMAAIYARAFPEGRAWSAEELAGLTRAPGFVVTSTDGFAIGREVAGEAELITIAVDPAAQGQGQGRALLAAFEAASEAQDYFLEVAADNGPAIALYSRLGWQETGRRKGYYARENGVAVDALTMAKHR